MAFDKKKAEVKKKGPETKPITTEEKKKAIDNAIAIIEKTYGQGAIMRLGTNRKMDVDVIPTGSMTLDMALGVGGVPKGRIVEIYGPESSGKTTVALQIVAQSQKAGGEVAFIDVEHALDPVYAASLGVDIDSMLVSQPDSGEQALEIMETLVRSGAIDVIVLDSVAAMVTKSEIDGEMGDTHVGLLARLMSQAMRKLTAAISKSNCVAIFINQVREKIGATPLERIVTDRDGWFSLKPNAEIPIVWVTIRNGDAMLARVPCMPGVERTAVLQIPDDSLRIGVERELDLPVERAELVRRPALQGVVELRVDPEQEGLALRHGRLSRWCRR